ncbi:MAG: carboxy terminal-processing peptidase [Williamsia sp.]|nr:carboxy terminal-processing peptidase [Williamsia sp.]
MFSKRSLPILVLILACGIFIGFSSLGTSENPPTKYEKILRNVGLMLKQVHYSPKDINDNFSKEVFKKYLEAVDPNKNILLQADVADLKKYETRIDDEILGAPVQFVPAVSAILKTRLAEAEAVSKEILAQPFDFTVDETLVTDTKKFDFPASADQRKEAWRKRLKYLALDRYANYLDEQDKNKTKAGFVAKSNEELEKNARSAVSRSMTKMFSNLKLKQDSDDNFNYFVNIITNSMDPHTSFMPPIEKRSFDEQMSGRFYGIGASLKEDEGGIKIETIVTGSPAWKSGQITVGDIITKVGQGNAEAIDLAGYSVTDAVQLIRGQKGTQVMLTLKKTDGNIKVVPLIREEIVLEETFARSQIVKNETNKTKIGYLFLPEFYVDFEDPKGAHSFEDVKKEIIKLKNEKVDGIVIDLRNNPGGSLQDVIDMVGLFIENGPVVQVKDRDGRPSVYRDFDKTVLYDGPLAVMVNEFSASASEIFAAAIQDYHRGIIIGSTSTYGKGTVQRAIGLDRDMGFMSTNSELGTIKLTLQKFYRIDGGSTQLKGVSSDVVLPDLYEHLKIREKDDPDALPWDEIQKADYKLWQPGYDYKEIENASAQRVKNSPSFNLIKDKTEWLAKQDDKAYPLKLGKYRDERKSVSAITKQLEAANKLSKELQIAPLTGEENKFANDKSKQDRQDAWVKGLKTDIWLNEAVNVVDDMVNHRATAMAAAKK